jgi:hypothetical protein
MQNEILDANHHNLDTWDSKKRVAVSDAIIEVNDNVKKVNNGRYLLFAMAALNLFLPILILFTSDTMQEETLYVTAGVVILVAIPYLALALFYPRNPKLFLILGLVFYVVSQTLSVALLGGSALQGFIWKIGVLVAFLYSLFGVSNWKRNLDKLRELGYPSSALAEARKGLKPLPRLRKRKM